MAGDTPLWQNYLLNPEKGAAEMNRLALAGLSFLFVVDAWAKNWLVLELPKARELGILWNLEGRGSLRDFDSPAGYRFSAFPPSPAVYQRGFDIIRRGQIAGDTYLANLTFPSGLDTNLDLHSLAIASRARFRLYVPDGFTTFSPERFVRIGEGGRIATFPMKGTIDASIPSARETILADPKEAAEHVTIVDLLRNDIGRVARNIEVPRYRFITEVAARERRLLQVSSEISGDLGLNWKDRVGDIFGKLLPAGSVTGAPKKRTCEIIREAEGYNRGWYTGVFGVFDGRSLDSAVMIRFVEKNSDRSLVYKSGGGITIYSDMDSEYSELKAKIYAPFA